jgi:hypothetical protein
MIRRDVMMVGIVMMLVIVMRPIVMMIPIMNVLVNGATANAQRKERQQAHHNDESHGQTPLRR